MTPAAALTPAGLELLRRLAGGRPAASEDPISPETAGMLLDAELATRDYTAATAAGGGGWRLTARGRTALSEWRAAGGTVIGGTQHAPAPAPARAVGGEEQRVCGACAAAHAPAPYWPCDPVVLYWPDIELRPDGWGWDGYLARLMNSPHDDALYDRLAAQVGTMEASSRWVAACRLYDHEADLAAAGDALRAATADAVRALEAAAARATELIRLGHAEFEGAAGTDLLDMLTGARAVARAAAALTHQALPEEHP